MRVLTVRNVPDDLYRVIAKRASANRRSLQQEVLGLLERARALGCDDPLAEAERIRQLLGGRALGDTVAELRADRER